MYVDDVDSSMEFYSDVLGFDSTYRVTADGVELGGLALREMLIEFIHAPKGSSSALLREKLGVGETHLGITVSRLNEALEALERRGVVVFDGPRTIGNATIAFIVGPGRRPVELIQFSGGEARSMDFLRPK
jgi:catechol 2,3-dioxygenase-like lactoylglutathione lyase family enzyme